MITRVPMSTVRERATDHFFAPSTMRFFSSILPRHAYTADGENFWFVTSERAPFGSRAWTIRRMGPDGRTTTAGEFQAYTSAQAATTALRREIHESVTLAWMVSKNASVGEAA